MKTIQEIDAAIQTFRNNNVWMQKRTRWEDDYKLYTLDPFDAGTGYKSYTSNTPSVYLDKLISMLCKAKLNIRVPLESLDEQGRAIASNTERLLYGCFNLNEERLSRIPDTPSLRQQRAFYSVIRGGFARCAYVYKSDKTGETIPLLYTWDIYNVAYSRGSSGAPWAAYTRPASKEELFETWGYKTESPELILVDFWDVENNGVYVGQDWLKKLTPHKIGYNPVTIHIVGSQPMLTQRTDLTINKNQGESALKSIRGVMPVLNEIVSDYLTLIHRGVKVPIGVWSPQGDVNLEADIWKTDKAAAVPFKTGTEVKPLITPGMPQDTLPALQIIDGEKQRGSFPNTAYGELGFRLSGFAISQLQAALETVLEPFATCMEQAYKMDCMQLIDQYAESTWKPIAVRGRTSYNTAFGYPASLEIAPKDLKKGWYPEIELVPVLPKDDAQKYQLAQIARTPDPVTGDPLLSDRTILDSIVGVEDPDLEDAKKNQQWGEKRPINRLFTAYLAALADNPNVQTNIKAQNILAELKMLMGQGQTQPNVGQSPSQPSPQASPTGQMSLETPGVGLPPDETGVSSSILPPEMLGGVPGGAMNATGAGG